MRLCFLAPLVGLLFLATIPSVSAAPVYVRFNTTLGNIDVELTLDATPLNVNNFLNYVNSGTYANAVVQRSISGFIWQCGGFDLVSNSSGNTINPTAVNSAVMGESNFETGKTTALLNTRGTIALALSAGPDSGLNEWFFNEVDNPGLDNTSDSGPFTAFGVVANNASLAVMDAISNAPVPVDVVSEVLDPNQNNGFFAPFQDCPLINYNASNGLLISNLILINSITQFTTQDFAAWQAANPVAGQPPAATADAFADGVPNLFKYLFDINPATAMTAADYAKLPKPGITTVSSTKVGTLTYHQRQNMVGVYITVQTSTDLNTWTTVTSPTIVQTGTDATTSDPIMQVQVPLTNPQFIRLNVTQSPPL